MKIGLVTHPLEGNYGGILQNYALQTVLRRLGHNPITLRTGKDPMIVYVNWLLSIIKNAFAAVLGRKYHWRKSPWSVKKNRVLLYSFVYRYIECTNKVQKISKALVLNYKIDALIVGSDQVWRPKMVRDIYEMFLEFAVGIDMIKISYAASLGTDEWPFSAEQSEKCKILASQFNSISVRENNAVNLIRDNWGMDVTWCLDPTMLLCKEDYESLIVDEPKRKGIVFAYLLDPSEDKRVFAEGVASQLNSKVKLLSAGKNLEGKVSIENWLSFFRDAEAIVTDSYHGTVFSLIFHKSFYVFANHERGNSRFETLIDCFNIRNCFVEDVNELAPRKIDWKFIDDKLAIYKEQSTKYLIDNLH